MSIMKDAEQIIVDLFARYEQDPADMPDEWREGTRQVTGAVRARRVGNFIAGMTDRFALMEHQRLFDSTPDLR
jgi:dGTPase